MRKVSLKKIDLLIFLIFLSVFIWLTYYGQHLTGFPTGTDTYAHLFRIKFVLDNFPNINWNPLWDGGTLFWLWSHPPFPSVFQATLVKVFSISPEVVLTLVAASSYFLMLLGIYYFVFSGWGRWPAILAVFLILSNPGSFGWWSGGNYSRIFALGFWGLSLGFSASYLLAGKKRRSLIASVLFSALALGSHLLIGALTMTSIALMIFFWEKEKKLNSFFKLIILPTLMTSYWYLPLTLLGNVGRRFIGGFGAYPIRLLNFIYPGYLEDHFALLPFLPSVFVFACFLYIFLKEKKKSVSIKPILYICLFSFIYLVIGYIPGYPKNAYIDGLPPISAFPIFAFFFAIFTPVFLSKVRLKRLRKGIYFTLYLLAIGGIIINRQFLIKARRDVSLPKTWQFQYQKTLKLNPNEKNYRFGTDSAFVGDWFNYQFNIPQTRDYFNLGHIYPDWIAYLERAVWFDEGNYEETNFLLDWYSVKHFVVGNPHFKAGKFYNQPDAYKLVAEQFPANRGPETVGGNLANEIFQFEFLQATPMLTSTDTPTILVIASDSSYDSFIRAIAQSNLNSKKIIPIKAGERLSIFNDNDLKNFPAIFIYGVSLSKKEEALLGRYIKAGGKVVIESGGGDFFVGELPDFFPLAQISKASVLGNWDAEWVGDKNFDTSLFSPLDYDGDPWKVHQADLDSLNSWARPLVIRNDKIWAAEGKLGDGHIIWLGFNLPFHIVRTKNSEEAKLFKFLIYDHLGLKEGEVLSVGEFVGNEERRIGLAKKATGVLLKESYFRNWQAHTFKNGQRQKLRILRAGPDFMYLNNPGGEVVVFEYGTSLIEKLGWGVSITSFVYFIFIIIKWSEQDTVGVIIKKVEDWWNEH